MRARPQGRAAAVMLAAEVVGRVVELWLDVGRGLGVVPAVGRAAEVVGRVALRLDQAQHVDLQFVGVVFATR